MTEPITRSARRVLICGSRTYRDAHAIARIIFHLPNDAVVIHGADFKARATREIIERVGLSFAS